MKYSLKESDLLEQHFTVYYLKGPADFFKMGEECPRIEKDLYQSKETFMLPCIKQ
jgi:hypothetical protein